MQQYKAEKSARQMHAVHRGMLKGLGSIMLADAVNVTDMSVCEGKYKGCDSLAENILEVAKSINDKCAVLYFNEKEYYKCEADIAEPVCAQVDRDFPMMCGPDGFAYSGKTGYTVDHGYFGSESPANIHGAFCNGCAQIERAGGCFASSSQVEVEGRGVVSLGEVEVGDMVRSFDLVGQVPVWTRVILTHTHIDPAATLAISHHKGAISLTTTHPLHLASGERKRARDIKVGDLLMHSTGAVEVTGVRGGAELVKYVLTENDKLLVEGLVAPVESTMAASFELLPFHFLNLCQVLGLKSVRAALYTIFESPLLSNLEALLDAALALSLHNPLASHRHLAVAHTSAF